MGEVGILGDEPDDSHEEGIEVREKRGTGSSEEREKDIRGGTFW